MKNETCKLYFRDFWIFLPKIIKMELYNSELYRFKVGAFFETQCRLLNKPLCMQPEFIFWRILPSLSDLITFEILLFSCRCIRAYPILNTIVICILFIPNLTTVLGV